MRDSFNYVFAILFCIISSAGYAQGVKNLSSIKKNNSFQPASVWHDTKGEVINAHGGGILYSNNTYYWFGEKRDREASEGINVYSSTDLYNWKFEALALSPDEDAKSEITKGCLMERPKVLYNEKTKKYVMWFHLELKGQGYNAARAAVAISDKVTGPYKFISSFRPNGNMSRDMTLFKEDNGDAYHIYASSDNYDLRLAKLSDDYLHSTALDTLILRQHREAPAIFKYRNRYYLISSGCTWWEPNQANVHVASSLFGPWEYSGNPMRGPNAEITFGGQSTYILPVQGKDDTFIFMADKWNPQNLKDSRYIWLPVTLAQGKVVINWKDKWAFEDL